MKDNRTTVKRSLIVSAIALVLTAALLIGTTFAWFTSTAQTSVSKVQAGKLQVALYKGGQLLNADDVLTWKKAEGQTGDVLWEPGCTYNLEDVTIKNVGTLALKYKVVITGIKGDAELNNAIEWTVNGTDLDADHSLAVDAADTLEISGHMKEKANNDYQGQSIDGITIKVVATQDTVEYDSKDQNYDANATYPLAATTSELKTSLTLTDIPVDSTTQKHVPVEVSVGNPVVEDIAYSENNSGYTGKGVMLGNTNLNKYAAAPAKEGEYSFVFKDGTITSAATGYQSIDGFTDTSVYMLLPGNSDVTFENMTFNGVVSFDIQKYTSPWSHLNSITFKNCTFNGIIVGTCPASYVTIDGCTFNNYTNTMYANNSNPIWWRADYEGTGANATYIKAFTFTNNTVTSTRPIKIERIGRDGCNPVFTFKNNTFDITTQSGDTVTKNMAINIGQLDNTSKFTLIDDGNTISANTASLYTAAKEGDGSNQYIAVSGNKVLDGNGNEKVITGLVWKTTTKETFEMKSIA